MKKLLSFCMFAFAILCCSFCTIFSSKVNACDICDELNVFCSTNTDKTPENFYCAKVQHIDDKYRALAKLPDKDIDYVISVSIFTKAGYSESINLGICKGSVKYFTLGVMYDVTSVYTPKMLSFMYGESYILFAKIFKNLIESCPRICDARSIRMYRNPRPSHLGDRKIHNYEYETFLSVFKIISGFGQFEQCISLPLENRDKGVRNVNFYFRDYEPVFLKARRVHNLGKV